MSDSDAIFEKLEKSLAEAQSTQDASIPKARAEALGFTEIAPISDKMMFAWTIRSGDKSVVLEYRFYDSSSPFSIQPDVNVFSLKLMRDEVVEKSKDVRFPDKGIYG